MPQSIAFHGAARTVTGSKHLLTLDGHTVLVDCGLFQGPRELRELNWMDFAFDPAGLDAVVLTHAHTDHIGMLPRLVKLGYRGPVYATPGTIGLCRISLPDSGRIQEEDARYHNRHGTSRHNPAEPLYTEGDAYEAIKLLRPVHYHQFQELPGGATFRFAPAGHILGSAFAEVYFANGERILMGGDLGRWDRPIIKDPTMMEYAEYLVVESTYGDRVHPDTDPKEEIARVLKRAWEERGVVIVPSFAIGRTQELLWYVHELYEEGRLERVPIYVDSPMANSVTLLTVQQTEEHDQDLKLDMSEGRSPFAQDIVRFVRDRQMSKELNDAGGPMVIIAGSGMVSGGRVLHHLRHRLDDPATTVLFTGYQAEGTMGREILEGAPTVRILGHDVEVRASVEQLDSLSAHADSNEILRWLRGFKEPPRKTFLVHGEPEAQEALAVRIQSELGWEVAIPRQGDSYDL